MKDKVKTPVADFLSEYEERSAVRMHMPGHKGRTDGYGHDITEIKGADDLFSPSGIIAKSEDIASRLFGAKTVYSTEGSSLSIRTMVHLAVSYAKSVGRCARLAAARGVHKSFVSALALTGAEVDWLCPKGSTYMTSMLTAEYVDEYFKAQTELPIALYVTSPDYLGNMQNIEALAEICERYGVLLLVDNAHGAYLKFLTPSRHPIDLGAHMCADSAHKTLPVLTGGGYLHISDGAPEFIKERVKDSMMLYASTSPSYLITESLDLANAYISGGYRERLTEICRAIGEIKERLSTLGYEVIGDEPMKITLGTREYGYSGDEVYEYMYGMGIVAEFSDREHIVFMPSEKTEPDELERLCKALSELPRRTALGGAAPSFALPERAMSVREAVFSQSECIPVSSALGRVLSDARIGCPPAVPIAVPGEIIDESVMRSFEYYGIENIYTVK